MSVDYETTIMDHYTKRAFGGNAGIEPTPAEPQSDMLTVTPKSP